MCFVLSIPGTIIGKESLTHRTLGTRRQCFSVKAGGYWLISSSRVVGPAGYWYLLMRFISSSRIPVYEIYFINSNPVYQAISENFQILPWNENICSHLWKWDSFGKTILGASIFLGAKRSKKQHFQGAFWLVLGRVQWSAGTHTHLWLQTLYRMEDHDGVLRAEEITAYVKGEHHFDLAEERWNERRRLVLTCCFFSMKHGIRDESTTRSSGVE